eukprot:1160901-Pelagomonas_calceolata.AAC.1
MYGRREGWEGVATAPQLPQPLPLIPFPFQVQYVKESKRSARADRSGDLHGDHIGVVMGCQWVKIWQRG